VELAHHEQAGFRGGGRQCAVTSAFPRYAQRFQVVSAAALRLAPGVAVVDDRGEIGVGLGDFVQMSELRGDGAIAAVISRVSE
jgi:hypothetical protein